MQSQGKPSTLNVIVNSVCKLLAECFPSGVKSGGRILLYFVGKEKSLVCESAARSSVARTVSVSYKVFNPLPCRNSFAFEFSEYAALSAGFRKTVELVRGIIILFAQFLSPLSFVTLLPFGR